MGLQDAIGRIAGVGVTKLSALGGGCVGDVFRVSLEDGRTIVAKTGDSGCDLALEGFMLDYLGKHSRLPVPVVIHAEDTLLLMSHIEAGSALNAKSQTHAADLVADLHGVTAKAFGLERETLIGGLRQPNPWTASWVAFFRDWRLLSMARAALDAGRLPGRLMSRIETLAGRLGTWLEEPKAPSLLHGDLWTGNVLCAGDRIAGFVDPAIYYGDAEMDLAFGALFGTFDAPFFDRYQERRPLRPGFFEERRDLYNLYPLLVHVRLFGGSYVGSVERTLVRYGV